MWSTLPTGCRTSGKWCRPSAKWWAQRITPAPSSSALPQPRYIHTHDFVMCPFGVFLCSINSYLIILWSCSIYILCWYSISLCKCTGLYKFHSKSLFHFITRALKFITSVQYLKFGKMVPSLVEVDSTFYLHSSNWDRDGELKGPCKCIYWHASALLIWTAPGDEPNCVVFESGGRELGPWE